MINCQLHFGTRSYCRTKIFRRFFFRFINSEWSERAFSTFHVLLIGLQLSDFKIKLKIKSVGGRGLVKRMFFRMAQKFHPYQSKTQNHIRLEFLEGHFPIFQRAFKKRREKTDKFQREKPIFAK